MNGRPSILSQSVVIGIAFAFFIVYQQRQKRWGLTFKALTGELVLQGTRGTGSAQSSANPADIGGALGIIANPAPQPQQPILGGVVAPGTNIGGGNATAGNQNVGTTVSPLGGFLAPGSSIGH